MLQFLNLIYGDSEGYIDLVTKSEEGQLDSERWFSWPSEQTLAARYCELRADEDVYCSVSVFSNELRVKDDPAAVTRTVYADADTCAPENFRLPPSIAVQTSEGHWHCWWVLDEAVPAKDAAEASHRVAKAHLAQGCDKSGWIQSKLLRVPGTSNTKRGEPEPVEATYSGEVYTLDTINAVYSDIDISPEVLLDAAQPDPVSKSARIKLEQQLDAAGLSDLYLQKPKEGQSWSERLFKLELELFRLGMEPQEVFSLARESACNKYAPENAGQRTQQGDVIPKRGDPDGVLWKDVQKAYAEYLATSIVQVEEMTLTAREVKRSEFLSMDERRYCLDNPTFIDQYVDWVATRTDSAETYQRSLAWMLLSSVFGARGFLPLTWGQTELNLWILLLGDTCQPLYSKILTPEGWTTMGEVSVGDLVIGSNGSPTAVRSVNRIKTDDVYKMTLRNGSVVESTLDHLWSVTLNGKRQVVTLEWIKRQVDKGYHVVVQHLTGPVQFPRRALPVDPYLLGVWLAEGCRSDDGYGARFASDGEIAPLVSAVLPEELNLVHYGSPERMTFDICRKDVTRTGPQGINSVRDGLRTLGLITKYQKNRWIPQEYLFSSVEDRLSLLQGIMDGDGSADKNGSARFECISEQLTRDVAVLAKSLGLMVGGVLDAGMTVADNSIYRVNMRMMDSKINPFRLQRKAIRVTVPEKIYNGVLSIEYSRRTEVRCIEVEAEDNLYVTDDFIVTHNTQTRKTTAKNLFMHAVHNYETQTGLKVDIGSETTAEALVMELGQRDGKVSLLHRDEIAGFFSEMLTKNYRAGTLETLTDLYDGRVPVVLRATKDSGNKNRARTIFNFVGVGIRKKTANILTKDYFESGFLARMLWSVADPGPRRKGSEDLHFNEPDVNTHRYDSVLDDIVTDLITRVRMWPEEKPVAIRMDKAALNRYNRWAEEAMQIAERYGDGDIVVPAFQRMKTSIAKASALLAMYEQSKEIKLTHLLPALAQAELWFNDMIRMASEVSSSEFERRLDAVEKYISSGREGLMLESSVRRKFAQLRPREIDEVFSALKAQGRVRSKPGQKLEAL